MHMMGGFVNVEIFSLILNFAIFIQKDLFGSVTYLENGLILSKEKQKVANLLWLLGVVLMIY